MHYPAELKFGDFKLSAHLILETAAFIVGFRYFLFLRKKQSDRINDSNRVWIIIGATFGAFFFSRLVGAFENPLSFFQSKHPFLYFYANKTIVGGLLGGLLLVEITKKIIGESSSSGDLFTFPLILAMIIGRIGCFTSGVYEDTYGNVTSSVFGIDMGDGLHRHPVTLYEIAFLIALWITLAALEKRYTFISGYRFQFFLIAYLLFRFALNFIKPKYTYFMGLGTIQIICLIGLVYYIKTIFRIVFKPKKLLVHDK